MSKADLLRRLNAASATVKEELANTPPDPTRFMTAKELVCIKRQMAERYGPGSDPAQPYADYLDGCHPLWNHPMYEQTAQSLTTDLTEQQCAEIWRRHCEQPWKQRRLRGKS